MVRSGGDFRTALQFLEDTAAAEVHNGAHLPNKTTGLQKQTNVGVSLAASALLHACLPLVSLLVCEDRYSYEMSFSGSTAL